VLLIKKTTSINTTELGLINGHVTPQLKNVFKSKTKFEKNQFYIEDVAHQHTFPLKSLKFRTNKTDFSQTLGFEHGLFICSTGIKGITWLLAKTMVYA
jgi:hypothetical protein